MLTNYDLIVERVYCSLTRPFQLDNFPIDVPWVAPCVYVHLYKNKKSEKYILTLECDFNSFEANILVENGVCPDFGDVIISSEDALFFKKELLQLGRRYFEHHFPEYEFFMGKLLSIIPCQTDFGISYHENGFYNKSNKSIFIATNRTEFDIVFSTLHEYTHFLLDSIFPRSLQERMTVLEYLKDEHEFICNSVAFKVLAEHYPDYVKDCFFDELFKFTNAIKDKETFELVSTIMLDLNTGKKISSNAVSLINELSKQISNELSKAIPITDEQTLSSIKQNQLVILEKTDNKKLLNLIEKTITPLLLKE